MSNIKITTNSGSNISIAVKPSTSVSVKQGSQPAVSIKGVVGAVHDLTGTDFGFLYKSGDNKISTSAITYDVNSQKVTFPGGIELLSIYDQNGSRGTSGQILSSTGTALDWINLTEIAGVNGTGTANYVAKWTDGDSITDSTIYDNGTNVGIGTSSPNEKLVVHGNLWLQDVDPIIYGYNKSTSIDLYNNSAGIDLNTPSSNKPINLNGRLVVAGTSTFSDRLILIGANRYIDGGAGNRLTVYSGQADMSFKIGHPTVGNFYWYDKDDNTMMTLTRGGNLGIGTTSPSWKLHVNTTTRAGIFGYGTPWTSDGVFYIGAYYATHKPLLVQHHASAANSNSYFFAQFRNGDDEDVIQFRTNGSADFNGSLKVNSTNNLGRITVNPTTDSNDAIGIDERGFIAFADGGVLNTRFRGLPGGGFQFQDASYATFFNLSKGSNSYLNTTGNFGIGTTSPSEKLHVSGNIALSDESELYIKGSTSSRKIVRLLNEGDKGLITINRADVTLVSLSSDVQRGHTFFNGLNVNVGIGTTAPSEKLEVAGKAIIRKSGTATPHADTDFLVTDATAALSTAQMEILGGNNASSILYFSDEDSFSVGGIRYLHSDNSMHLRVNGSDRVHITSAGNVGIGTTNPISKFQVNGTARFAGGSVYLKVESNRVVIEDNYLFASYQGGISFYAYDSVFRGLIRSDTSGGSALQLGDTQERMRIVNGNVGIGTTSPSEKLHIAQSSDWNGLKITGYDDQSSDYLKIHIGTTPMVRYQSNLEHNFYIGNITIFEINSGTIEHRVKTKSADNLLHVFGTNNDAYLGYSNADDKFKINFASSSNPVIDSDTVFELDGTGVNVIGNFDVTGTANIGTDLTVEGNLTVNGTTTTLNTTELTIEDKNIVLANGAVDSAAANGAGITIDGADATMSYNSTKDSFDFNKEVVVDKGVTNQRAKLEDTGLYISRTSNGDYSSYVEGANNNLHIKARSDIKFIGNQTTILTVYESSQSVGIGTTNPSQKLDVSGNVNITGAIYGGNEIRLGSAQWLRFGTKPTLWADPTTVILRGGSGNDAFRYQDSSGNEKLRITSDGKVGIEVTNPLAKLHVSSTTGWGGIFERGIKDGATSTYSHNYSAGNAHILGRGLILESSLVLSSSTPDASTVEYRFRHISNKLSLQTVVAGVTTNENVITFDSDNVGIGTDSPGHKLDVAGDIGVGQNDGFYVNNTNVGIERTANDLVLGGYGGIRFKSSATNVTNQSERMRLTSAGNLGIGTTSPSSTFHTVGKSTEDLATLGSELLNAQTASGTGWTGTDIEQGYTHTPGNTDRLVTTFTPAVNTVYLIDIAVTGLTAGRVDIIYLGGQERSVYTGNTASRKIAIRTTTTDPLEVSVQSATDGTVSFLSIKEVQDSIPSVTFGNSNDDDALQIRVPNFNSIYIGHRAGKKKIETFNTSNTGIGFSSLAHNVEGSNNTAIGYNTLASTANSSYNVAIGNNNLQNYTKAGNTYNIAIGNAVMYGNDITTASGNIMMGFWSGQNLTTAANNIGIGYDVYRNLTSGGTNVSIGPNSSRDLTTGNTNIAIGSHSLHLATTAVSNVAIGYNAGRYVADNSALTTNSRSIYIGRDTKGSTVGADNEIVIGHEAVGIGQDSVVIGNDSILTTALKGKVGIGTTSPDASAILDLDSTTQGVLFPRMTGAERTAISSPATGLIVYQTDADEGLYIYKSTGWIQII